jgi:STAS-like domain of unknown function (DUF4325)
MSIVSGYASLHASVRDGLQIGDQGIPFNGTLVMARIGYSHKVDLSDALVFAGRRHVPTDYIETHFEQDTDGNVKFLLKNESEGFGSRSAGEPVRRRLLNVIRAVDNGRAILDFDGVVLVSSSYADEVVGKLFIELGPIEFMRKVELQNLGPLVKGLVERAIVQRATAQGS